jgi:hypothetical protein
VGHALVSQELPSYPAARGGEHLGAEPAGDADRGQPHAPGGRVDQDPVTWAYCGEPYQRKVRRDHREQRGGLRQGQPGGLAHHPNRVERRVGREQRRVKATTTRCLSYLQ